MAEHYLRDELYELVKNDSSIFEFLQAGSLDGIWYWDLTNPSEEWLSPAFKQFFGYEDHEMEHTPTWWQEHINPDDLAVVLDNYEKHCADPDHPYDQIVQYTHRDGHPRWVRCRGIAVRDEDGTPIRMLGAHNDVTALKLTEQRLERVVDALESFGDSVAHDLLTPLTTVTGMAETLKKIINDDTLSAEGEFVDEVIDRIAHAARRGASMVRDLLGYARTGASVEQFLPIDLNSVVDWAMAMLQEEFQRAEATVEVAQLPNVRGSEAALRQVFLNLLSNAVKYRDPDRGLLVTITASVAENAMVSVAVEDTGPGISHDDRARIFRLGERGDRQPVSGAGVGLATCQLIVAQHGGRIQVTDPEHGGSGARFVVSIPGVTTSDELLESPTYATT